MKKIISVGSLLWLPLFLLGQVSVPFTAANWEFSGEHRFASYQGQQALQLTSNGTAQLKDATLENGIIEYDVAFPEKRGFFGVHFRIDDPGNYEEFYMRAHQSGKPDAMQYTPTFNGLNAWQLYHGPGFGAAKVYQYDTWTHIKLVIQDQQMEVYIGDMETPVLYAFDLKRKAQAGGIALYTFLAQPYFANFTYHKLENPGIQGHPPVIEPLSEETVQRWSLSQAMDGSQLAGGYQLPQTWLDQAKWKSYTVEASGTLNLAQHAARNGPAETMMARFEVSSEASQAKGLTIGYSDMARVYVNGQLVYSGHRRFRSRDYRYLGTIGDFDTVYLPLKAGTNQIIIAVSEQMGGWGIRARWDNMESLRWLE